MKSLDYVLTRAPRTGNFPRILMIGPALTMFLLAASVVPAKYVEESTSPDAWSEAANRKSTVTGTVFDSEGHPVPGATVGVRRSYQEDGTILIHARLKHMTTTGPDGTFEITGLEAVKVEIAARMEGYEGDTSGEIPTGTTGVRLTLHRQGAIGGIVLDEDGSPLPGAEVRLLTDDSGRPGFREEDLVDTVESGEDGRWKISRLDPGDYAAYAVDGDHRSDLVRKISLSSGEQKTAVELRLTREAVSVSGRVIDRHSRDGIAGAEVSLFPELSGIEPVLQRRTGEEGEFLFDNIRPGKYRVWVNDVHGYVRSGLSVPLNVEVSSASGDIDDITFELEKPATVMGQVVLPSREPAEGATVRPVGNDLERYYEGVTSDQLGVFEVTDVEPGVEFRLIAEVEGYPPAVSSPMTLEPGETRYDIRLELGSGSAISGRVAYENGEPVSEGFSVRVSSPEFDIHYDESPVAATGSYRIEGVAPGPAVVRLFRHGPDGIFGRETDSNTREITVETDRDLDGVDFTVSRPGALDGFLAGRVTDPDGNGVPGVRVFVSAIRKPGEERRGQGDLGRTITGGNGEFRIDNLQRGPFRVRLSPGGTALPVVTEPISGERIEVMSPGDDVVIALKRYVTVSGKVVDGETGEPVPSFEIRGLRGGSTTEFNSPDGTFRFERVPPSSGSLIIEVADRGTVSYPLEITGDEDVTGIVIEVP